MRTRSKTSISSSSADGPRTRTGAGCKSKSKKSESAPQSGVLQQRREKRSYAKTENNGEDTDGSFRFSWDEFSNDDECAPKMTKIKIIKRDPTSPKKMFGQSRSDTDTSTTTGAGTANTNGQRPTSSSYVRLVKVENDATVTDEVSDDDQENFNYMQIRMQNMKQNEDFLASIGMFKAKEELKQSVTPARKTAIQRGLKVKRDPVEPFPRRQSLRINKLDPSGKPLPETDPNSQAFRSLDSVPFSQLMFSKEDVLVRLPKGPVGLKDCVYSKYDQEKAFNDVDQFSSFIQNKQENNSTAPKVEIGDNESEEITFFDKMSLSEERVAKVVPERVFSLDWYPSTEKLMVVAGDKCGHIGFWNVLAEENTESEIVTAFKPHVKPVSQLAFSRWDKQRLYSCSYDATLRCLDLDKCVFDEIFSLPEEDDDLLRDFSFVDSNVMVVAQYTGVFSVVDIRTPSTSGENCYQASKKNLHTIHVNPQSSNHFITTGADASINLWDFRHLNKKCPKPVTTVKDHSKTVSSAYFSPNGRQILSCSTDDTILIYSVESSSNIALSQRIRHNNCTGRWLTKFRPTWHPTVDDVFVSGSMARPRRVEIFNSTKGSLISCLESDNLNSVCSLNKFHPMKPTMMAGANSSGRLHIFM